MGLSKKKIKEINQISVYEEILRYYGYDYLSFIATDNPPDMWNDEDKRFFDMVNEIESKMKEKIINLLSSNESRKNNEKDPCHSRGNSGIYR